MRRLLSVFALVLATGTAAYAAPPPQDDPAAVIRLYYADLDHGAYRDAYDLWEHDQPTAQQSRPFAAFVKGFADTAATYVITGKSIDEEGAAGSAYITVPVNIRAELKNGQHQHFTGTDTLRRINITPKPGRWHIYSADLKQER